MPPDNLDLADIRRLVIIAMFSDDVLFAQLALKGGNALNLIYGLGSRSSVDVDLSLEQDFVDPDDARERIFRALKARFSEVGMRVFDERFSKRPVQAKVGEERWGGYQVDFKLIDEAKYNAMKADPDRARREALVIGPGNQRVFVIQISKFEFCQGKVETDLQDYSIFVYTPEMIAIEKLRAICQQMAEYPLRRYSTPRARDFYDIHSTVTARGVNLGTSESADLVRNIFAAKDVDLGLLPKIKEYREFHRQDWPAVELTVSGDLKPFDFYFDFVVAQTELLKALWEK
ncbi:MAG: nucleotidyl transferase AbiEii/AbiGii toxin family protein [Candidatus Acidiferrales bacterium]